MNIQSDWLRLESDVRRRWPELSDDDVARIDGDSDALCSVIEERYQVSHEDAERQVHDFLDKRGISVDGSGGSSGGPRNQSSRSPAPMGADERRRKEEERKRQSQGTEEQTETPEESGE